MALNAFSVNTIALSQMPTASFWCTVAIILVGYSMSGKNYSVKSVQIAQQLSCSFEICRLPIQTNRNVTLSRNHMKFNH